MSNELPVASLDRFLAHYAQLVGVLRAQGMCLQWGLSEEAFAKGPRRSAENRFSGAPPAQAVGTDVKLLDRTSITARDARTAAITTSDGRKFATVDGGKTRQRQ